MKMRSICDKISEYKSNRSNAIIQLHFGITILTMSIKLLSLFVAFIICIYALDVAVARPDTADNGPEPLEDIGLEFNGPSEREKRQLPCAINGGCRKGYCWAGCIGALSPIHLGNSYNFNK